MGRDREGILARRAVFIAATMAGMAAATPSRAGGGMGGGGAGGAGGSGGFGGAGGGQIGGAQNCLTSAGDGGYAGAQVCLEPAYDDDAGGAGGGGRGDIVVSGCGCELPAYAGDDMAWLVALGAALAALRRRRAG